jgi:methylamine utilization protein MauE
VQAAPPGTSSPPPTAADVGRATRYVLALAFAWAGAAGAWRLSTFARTVADSGLVPDGAARAVALTWCIAALAAAVALASPRTARVGAWLALVVAGTATVVSVAAWIRGTPVMCTCIRPAARRSTRDHVEALVSDVVLLALALVAWRTTRRRLASS